MKQETNNHVVAIIMPIYNCEKYVGEMLDSIICQTFSDWILLAVDDDSTDCSFSILQDYALKDNRINPIKRNREPKGAQTCRNMGFELSEGAKYVIFFDSDDVIAPYCLEQRVAVIESHPDLDFAVFPAKNFRTEPHDKSNRFFGVKKQKDDYLNFLFPWLSFVVWCNIYKRESLVSFGIQWDEKVLINQDSDFNIQAMHRGMKYDYAEKSKIDYYYRQSSEGSVSKKRRQISRLDSFLYLIDKYNATFTKQEKEKYHMAISHRLLYFAEIFAQDERRYKTLINHPFFNASWWTKLRLKLLVPYIGHTRLLKLFFPVLKKKFRRFVNDYTKESVSIAKKIM